MYTQLVLSLFLGLSKDHTLCIFIKCIRVNLNEFIVWIVGGDFERYQILEERFFAMK